MTVRDLARKTLLLIGAISSGGNVSANESSDFLSSLNDLLESWSLEGLMLQTIARESFNTVANQAAYSMGTGLDFSSTRPIEIQKVNISISGVEYPVDIITLAQWAAIAQKSLTSDIPSVVYIEETPTYQKLNFYPKPNAVMQAIVYSKKPFTAFTAITDSISFSLGGTRALKLNMAVEIAPEYGKALSPDVVRDAASSKALLMRKNVKPAFMKSDFGNGGKNFNPYTGE